MRCAPRPGPGRLGGIIELAGEGRNQPVALESGYDPVALGQPVAVAWHERVQVDQVPDPVADVLQRARDHAPAVGEAEQHDPVEILIQHHVDHIGDVGGQAHLRAGQMDPLADASQAGREHLVPGRSQRRADLTEAVRAAPCAMHQDKRRHANL